MVTFWGERTLAFFLLYLMGAPVRSQYSVEGPLSLFASGLNPNPQTRSPSSAEIPTGTGTMDMFRKNRTQIVFTQNFTGIFQKQCCDLLDMVK